MTSICNLCKAPVTRIHPHLLRHHHRCDYCHKWSASKEKHAALDRCRKKCTDCNKWVSYAEKDTHRQPCPECNKLVCDLSDHKYKAHPRVGFVAPATAPVTTVQRTAGQRIWVTKKCAVHAAEAHTSRDVIRACAHCRINTFVR